MRKYLLSAMAVGAMLFAIGCTISRYPIDEHPQVKADPRLAGKWRPIGKDSGSIYIVTPKNEFEYSITAKGQDRNKMKLIAFLSDVNGARFLNIYSPKDTGYSFFRILDIDAEGKQVSVSTVDDSTMIYLSGSVEVRTRISDRLNNRDFYSDTVKLRKEK